MRIVVALGGNALLRRGEALTMENQRQNIRVAVEALAPMALEHDLVITHGNGPQVGLLVLQSAACQSAGMFPLDVLDAGTEGMIGYLIEQELVNTLPPDKHCVSLLTQVEVSPEDPAFKMPTKPIGPVYNKANAERLAEQRGWCVAPDGEHYRRVVASPRPRKILELETIEWLVSQGVVVICAGGGGIPVVRRTDGSLVGIEAVIDKDWASSLLACELRADLLLLLTDVEAVYENWGGACTTPIRHISVDAMRRFTFAPGSMAPKVEAACQFVERSGHTAGIGALKDAQAILNGVAGTLITP